MTLSVDPAALDGAGSALVATGDAVGTATTTLTSALSGCGSMCGNDPVGQEMGNAYDRSAEGLIKAFVAARNGITNLGDGVRFSAFNYSMAEAQSDVSGRAEPLPVPQLTGKMAVPSAPSAVGAGEDAPAGWGWVAKYIGMIWPNGDPNQLRAAAAAWTAAGTQLLTTEASAAGALGTIGAQQIPEGAAIGEAFSQSLRAASQVMSQCTTIAAQLITYAAHIDAVHAAIIDLLSRICDPMTGIKEVWDFLTDEDEDEIQKIANDIKVVVDNFKAESRALLSQIETTATAAENAIETLAPHADKIWDQFLHGTDVGRALDQTGQTLKGVGAQAWDIVSGLAGDVWKYNGVRMAVDPEGYLHDVGERAEQMAPLVGLGGDGAPGVGDVWKQVGKDISHWDLWKTNPAEAAGRSLTDVLSMLVPGGAATKVDRATVALEEASNALRTTTEKLPGAAADATKAVEGAPAVRPPEPSPWARPPESPPPGRTGEVPPAAPKSPEGAPAEPRPAPSNTPAPASPTETRPPADSPRQPAPVDTPPPRSEPAPAAASAPHSPPPGDIPPAAPSGSARLPAEAAQAAAPTAGVAAGASESVAGAASSTGGALSGVGERLGGVADSAGSGAGHVAEAAPPPSSGVGDRVPANVGGHDAGGASEGGRLDSGSHSLRDDFNSGRSGDSGTGGGRDDGAHSSDNPVPEDPLEGAHDQHGESPDQHPQVPGLTDEVRDAILSTEKGSRPDPSEYLPQSYIDEHLDKFREGVARFMPEQNFDKYGIAQRDGTSFVLTKHDADAMLAAGAGGPRALEHSLGLPEGFFEESSVVRIDIRHPERFELRMPSGNEAGANSQWLPGGLLPDGLPEAVIDGGSVPPDQVIVTTISPGR